MRVAEATEQASPASAAVFSAWDLQARPLRCQAQAVAPPSSPCLARQCHRAAALAAATRFPMCGRGRALAIAPSCGICFETTCGGGQIVAWVQLSTYAWCMISRSLSGCRSLCCSLHCACRDSPLAHDHQSACMHLRSIGLGAFAGQHPARLDQSACGVGGEKTAKHHPTASGLWCRCGYGCTAVAAVARECLVRLY